MIGRTLTEIRRELESLSTADGRFVVRCGRTGERPVPVDRLQFPDREAATEAARIAHAYRAALRRYDPRAPYYDFVVCETETTERAVKTGADDRTWTFPRAADQSPSRRALVAYCHDVAGAVFEALSDGDYDAIERDAMDAYLAAAETTPRDRLCLSLLSTTATTLQAELSVAEQATVLRRATAHLPVVDATETPVAAALEHLRGVSLVDDYEVDDAASIGGPTTVRLWGYELPVESERLPTLPVTIELLRRARRGAPVVERAERTGEDTWTLSLTTADGAAGLSCVPVDSEC